MNLLGAIKRKLHNWFWSGLDDIDGVRVRTQEEIVEEEQKWRDETQCSYLQCGFLDE